MLVPMVEQFYTTPKNLRWYEDKLLAKNNALPAAEVDKMIAAQDAALLQASGEVFDIVPEDAEPSVEAVSPVPVAGRSKPKAPKSGNLFDDLLGKD